MKIKVNVLNGRIVEQESFNKFLSLIGDGTHYFSSLNVSELSSIEDYRRLYFFYRDAIWEDRGEYTKEELHNVIKQLIIPELWEDSDNFTVESPHLCPITTKNLTQYGWKNFIEAVKDFAQNEFNIYF